MFASRSQGTIIEVMLGLGGQRCVQCGRNVRGLSDRRKEGKLWFCSQGCYLQHASILRNRGGKRPGPVRVVLKTLKWTVIVVVVVIVAAVIAAIAGVGSSTKTDSAGSGRHGAGSPPRANAPGSRTKPLRLGTIGGIGQGWRLKVLSVTPKADQQVLAVPYSNNDAPPNGAQDYMISLALRYTGGGKGNAATVMDRLGAMGRHNAAYKIGTDYCGKLPKPSLEDTFAVFSGQNTNGSVCFQIASNDAASLLLYADPPLMSSGGRRVWFALRR